MGSRNGSDETYVISLCDEILRLVAKREHTFDFLLGDVGMNGNRRRLPVDAYYPTLQLVVEYREKQHTQAVAFFDKAHRMTISGVPRRQQRALYDQRRRDELPKNGIQLVELSVSDFQHDAKQRLRRMRSSDLGVVQHVLEPWQWTHRLTSASR